TREMYETFSKVISDKAVYKDKARRSVVIGLPEVKNPSKGLAADEKTVKDLITYSGCPEAVKAFNNNEVTHHRHPRDRSPDHRPLKIEFRADSINDSFLSDLTPTQLKMEREARIEVRRRNLAAGKLQFGVRDYYIIEYRNPRPLPANYGNRAPNARNKNKSADSLTADLAASSSSSLCSTFTARSGSFTARRQSISRVSVFYANCRSIRCKLPQLSFLLSSLDFHIVCLTETWLDSTDSDAFLISGHSDYIAFRSDRAIVIDVHFTYTKDLPYHKIRLVNVYRSPSSPPNAFIDFLSFITPLISDTFPCILIGDYNYPDIDWKTLSSPTPSDLLDFISDHHFSQFVSFPTRLQNYLDLVFSNKDIIHNISPSPPISDHLSVVFDLRIPSPPSRKHTPSRMYRLANWQSINDSIFHHNWTIALSHLDVNQSYDYFLKCINSLLEMFVPLSKPSPFSRYPRNVRILYGKSRTLTRIAPNSNACIVMTKRFNSALHRFHCLLESRVVASSDSKAFYKLCSSRLNAPKSTPSGIIDPNGNLLLSNDDKCRAFSDFFSSVFTNPMHSPLPPPSPSIIFDLPTISHLHIISALSNLSPKINITPDNIPTKKTVKDLGVVFTPSLCFSEHIKEIIKKSNSKMHFLFKAFRSNCIDIYVKSFTTFILPSLETCSIIWNPINSVETTKNIERVQRDFTRKLYFRCSLPSVSYCNRLRSLNLTTLERRRFVTDIVFLHSILHRNYELDHSSLLTRSPLTRFVRNSHHFRISLPFFPPNSHTTLASRTISIWNSLPSPSVDLSRDSFRKFIRSQPNSFFP
ncbi:hypothetical protein PFISCL1PPCAC_20192, partial [Pristionchus fissidentatus]